MCETLESKIKKLQDIIDNSKNIVFFGGAGVSTASGIPDFRSENGLYNRKSLINGQSPEYMLSHTCYECETEEFFDFYRDNVCALGYKPNATHYKLAELEKAGKLKAVITQNIDGLHQLAGSKEVIELHGTIHKNRCVLCGRGYTAEFIKNSTGIPRCEDCLVQDAVIKPMVTLYEEQLPYGVFERAIEKVLEADVMIVAGTSLSVYPAANLLHYFNTKEGKKLVVINKGDIAAPKSVTLRINADMTEVFNQLVVR